MTIDWTPVVTAGVQALAVVIPVGAMIAAAWLRSHNQTLLANAVTTAGGVAYDAAHSATQGGTIDWQTARSVGIREGVAALTALAPAAVAAMGENATATTVIGALGNNLAADPTISAAGNAVATAVAGVGEEAIAAATGAAK